MMTKVWEFIKGGGWILIVAVVAAGWVKAEISRAVEVGKILADKARLDSAVTHLRGEVSEWVERDEENQLVINRLSTSLDSALADIAQWRNNTRTANARLDEALQQLGESGDTSTTNLVETISAAVDTLREDSRSCHSALAVCDSLRTEAVASADTSRVLLAQSDSLVQALSFQNDRMVKLLRPRFKPMNYVPWVIAVAEFFLLVTR